MTKELTYNQSFIDVMSDLAKINPQLIFKNGEDDKVEVKAISNDKAVCYILNAPKEYFSFDSESLAMIDYNRFHSYFNVFNKPNSDEKLADKTALTVEYSDDEYTEAVNLNIKSTKRNSSFKHRLANEDVIVKPSFNQVKFPSVDTKFSLTEDMFTDLLSMAKMTAADKMKFVFKDNTVKITLFNTKTQDTFDNEYEIDETVDGEFEIITPSNGFALMPKADYAVTVCKAGIMSFEQQRADDIALTLYIAKDRK